MPRATRSLWRVSNHADLAGRGGRRAGGRWHSTGRQIVYCAEAPTGALLETLVHLEVESLDELPRTNQLLRIAFPAGATFEEVEVASLPSDWKRRTLLTRSIGDAWLAAGRTVALRVPSAISPYAFNVLLNPQLLAGTGVRIVAKSRHPFNARPFKSVQSGSRARGRARRR